MASFFPPGLSDPTENCTITGYKLLCNTILPLERRKAPWYQIFSLGFAASAVLIAFFSYCAIRLTRKWSGESTWRPVKMKIGQSRGDDRNKVASTVLKSVEPSFKSFRISTDTAGGDKGLSAPSESSSLCRLHNPSADLHLFSVDINSLGTAALKPETLRLTVAGLIERYNQQNLAGMSIECSNSSDPQAVRGAVQILLEHHVPCVLYCQYGWEGLDEVGFQTLAGLIISNACILPSGQRRDYFEAGWLRKTMTACAQERETRPDFFLGFLDQWLHRPHPSVIQRAAKLAEHYGAVLEHSASHEDKCLPSSGSLPIGGLDYLRRPEKIALQKLWMSSSRATCSAFYSSSEVEHLDLDELDDIVPGAKAMLEPKPTCGPGGLPATELGPTMYSEKCPTHDCFESSVDGLPLANSGCFPLGVEPHTGHYQSIVQTQTHLCRLNMLSAVNGKEEQGLISGLEQLARHDACHVSVRNLIGGLYSRRIRVYRGLHTGFRVPDSTVLFWGVTDTQGDGDCQSVNIFVSLQAPSLAAVVLHTWLACHNVTRASRFEQELLLEKVSNLTHATDAQWSSFSAVKILDGTVTMSEVLQRRLDHLARGGADMSLSLSEVVGLYDAVEKLVIDSLYYGQRDTLHHLSGLLRKCYGRASAYNRQVDVAGDILALIYFSILRRAAFEDVYLETTDRCPVFLPQPDQAAVLAELWVLGSQCQDYFGIGPRDLGVIIYKRRTEELEGIGGVHGGQRCSNETMTMYASGESRATPNDHRRLSVTEVAIAKSGPTSFNMKMGRSFDTPSAMVLFCAPAVIDILLLTFLGRGVFLTAFMRPSHYQAAGYAILASLLLTAGVIGWVTSGGSHYLPHYAYDNMIYFHVQRFSGAVVLSLVVALGGGVAFAVGIELSAGLVFAAYMITVSTYLTLLGIMSTMHQHGSPLPSGRKAFLKAFCFLLLSPVISSFVNDYDLAIYLPIICAFLFGALVQYRSLCHKWSRWMDNIPTFSLDDVVEWYTNRMPSTPLPTGVCDSQEKMPPTSETVLKAQLDLKAAVDAYQGRTFRVPPHGDPFVANIAKGLPYIDWLFRVRGPEADIPELFSTAWFAALVEAVSRQRQMSRGLKEHNVLTLFRLARYDICQNVGLFLVALLDRWVMLIMNKRTGYPSIYTDARARYGLCLSIVYFCVGSVILEGSLHRYWGIKDDLEEEHMSSDQHAEDITAAIRKNRRRLYLRACTVVGLQLLITLGVIVIFLWLLVDSKETYIIFWTYILGYTCCIFFQLNRCFTNHLRLHVRIILTVAPCGFVIGCIVRGLPWTHRFLYADVAVMAATALCCAASTSALVLLEKPTLPAKLPSSSGVEACDPVVAVQRRVTGDLPSNRTTALRLSDLPESFKVGSTLRSNNGPAAQAITEAMQHVFAAVQSKPSWAIEVFHTVQDLWHRDRLGITVIGREQFIQASLSDYASLSYRDGEDLRIVLCYNPGQRVNQMQHRYRQLAALIAECAMYHVCHHLLEQPRARAVYAEQLARPGHVLPSRVETEIATATESELSLLARRSWSEQLQHLCLDIKVDTEWELLPHPIREAILCRVEELPTRQSQELSTWLATKDACMETIDYHVHLALAIHNACRQRLATMSLFSPPGQGLPIPVAKLAPVSTRHQPASHWRILSAIPFNAVKWVAVISGGSSNIERELHYLLHDGYVRTFCLRVSLALWKLCWLMQRFWVFWIFLYHRPGTAHIARLARKGTRRITKPNCIVVEHSRSTITGFSSVADDVLTLDVFEGRKTERPSERPIFSAAYDLHCRLQTMVEFDGSTSVYCYNPESRSRYPVRSEVVNDEWSRKGEYDRYGRLTKGILHVRGTQLDFTYRYAKPSRSSTSAIQAVYRLVGSDHTLTVCWGKPDSRIDRTWVPTTNVGSVIRRFKGQTYVTEYDRTHHRDPVLTTYVQDSLQGRRIVQDPPTMFSFENFLLTPPTHQSFVLDDLLILHHTSKIKRLLRRPAAGKLTGLFDLVQKFLQPGSSVYSPVCTSQLRTKLWDTWMNNNSLDAITACIVDEIILREEPLLRSYWRSRDSGRQGQARRHLDDNIDQIIAAIGIETDVSEKTLLAIRTGDLYSMGLGQDANTVTAQPQSCYDDSPDRISVIFNDIGCWPVAPGEGRTAKHGLLDNLLESQVDEKIANTDERDIVNTFVPLLTAYVKGCRTTRLSYEDLIELSNVFLSMGHYYQFKDYTRTWESPLLEQAWIEAWMKGYKDPNIIGPADCFHIMRPSLSDFQQALNIVIAYFFIFSVNIPDRCPRVFQSTHHGLSSLFGMVLRYRRGTTFGIWDHAILWRECCLNFSVAQCKLPVPVQYMLLSGIGVAAQVAYLHADVVLPCASLFNPMWEVELGSDGNRMFHRNLFRRKIDPIVNGISDMDAYKPLDVISTKTPTVIMLSNIQMIKGIKTAIQAADVIINKLGFTDYRLVIYGAKDREPGYALEMEKLIVEKKLGSHVVLAGFGNSKIVFRDAWLFLNSSLSEGLPLAIGEAALAGVPIVATEVGATALVLTDPDDCNTRYGEVVPPNDPVALARAQIRILAMVGPWAKFTEPTSGFSPLATTRYDLPDVIAPEDVGWLTERFYSHADDRRKLGYLSRKVVLRSFHGSRYIREHEQMYWIQWHMARMRSDPQLRPLPYEFGRPDPLYYQETQVQVEQDG